VKISQVCENNVALFHSCNEEWNVQRGTKRHATIGTPEVAGLENDRLTQNFLSIFDHPVDDFSASSLLVRGEKSFSCCRPFVSNFQTGYR